MFSYLSHLRRVCSGCVYIYTYIYIYISLVVLLVTFQLLDRDVRVRIRVYVSSGCIGYGLGVDGLDLWSSLGCER